MTSLHRPGWFVALAVVCLASACLHENCHPSITLPFFAAHAASAKVDTPAGFELGAIAHLFDGDSCLAIDGTCSVAPHLEVISEPRPDGHALWIVIDLPAIEGAATEALPPSAGSSVRVTATLHTSATDTMALAVRSGMMAVDGSKEHLIVMFDMELETPDHQRLTLSDGRVSILGCRVFHQDAICQPGD
jgi:hypothetical protein